MTCGLHDNTSQKQAVSLCVSPGCCIIFALFITRPIFPLDSHGHGRKHVFLGCQHERQFRRRSSSFFRSRHSLRSRRQRFRGPSLRLSVGDDAAKLDARVRRHTGRPRRSRDIACRCNSQANGRKAQQPARTVATAAFTGKLTCFSRTRTPRTTRHASRYVVVVVYVVIVVVAVHVVVVVFIMFILISLPLLTTNRRTPFSIFSIVHEISEPILPIQRSARPVQCPVWQSRRISRQPNISLPRCSQQRLCLVRRRRTWRSSSRFESILPRSQRTRSSSFSRRRDLSSKRRRRQPSFDQSEPSSEPTKSSS